MCLQYEVEAYFVRAGSLMPKRYMGYYIGYNKTDPDTSLYDWQVCGCMSHEQLVVPTASDATEWRL